MKERVIGESFSRSPWCVMGLPFDAVDMGKTCQLVGDAITERRRCFISTPNINFLIAAQRDEAFRQSVIDSDLSLADGMPIVLVARLLGIPLPERVAGSTLFERLRDHGTASDDPISVFFIGGELDVAKQACEALNRIQEGVHCVGSLNPGFGTVEEISSKAIIDQINAVNPDFVVVSLGAQKGQAWIQVNRARLHAPVISHLGAVVDFVAGQINRAPVWVQRAGIEWLWRIIEKPALWQRYFSDGVSFLSLLVTRVIPYALFLRRRKGVALEAAHVRVVDESDRVTLQLGGGLAEGNLEVIRESFSQEANSRKDICLDLSAVSYVDSAFIGLMLLLTKHQRERGKALTVESVPDEIRRIFEYNSALYLFEQMDL